MAEEFLKLTGISKAFGGTRALDDVGLTVNRGEVLGIVGENGAGKSTLMKILGGVVAPDAGRIEIAGQKRERLTIPESIGAGIALVHQELNLFDNLNVAANIFLGREPRRPGLFGIIDEPELTRRAAPFLASLSAGFSADAPLARLSLAEMQLVEIAKALSLEAQMVIMDEPTSSLTATETERLIEVIRGLRARGVAVILITHRLAEIEALADRVVVLRDGKLVAELTGAEIRADRMTRHMIGRDLKSVYRPPAAAPGAVALETVALRTARFPQAEVSLSVREGEILGMAGLIGAGRTELARTIFGLDAAQGGEIRLGGRPVSIGSPRAAMELGLCLVPEDRKAAGLILDFAIRDNIALPSLAALHRHWIVDTGAVDRLAEAQREALDIRAARMDMAAGALSGGNQQKVVLAKWMARSPQVLLFDEPTRGVDVGAKEEIYQHMRRMADAGAAILMISSDMEEVIGVSDRVAVMHEGRIAGFLGREALSEHAILSLAVGRSETHPAGSIR